MISRFYVKCPGCSSKILLRLSVGKDTEQPFYYVCNKCNLATRGKLVIWYTPSPGGKLELEDGQEIGTVENPDQVINIHPDMPAIPGAKEMYSPGGSPFLMHHQLLKDKFEEFLQRLNSFREGIDTNWKSVRRMIGYYLDRNWEQFDNQGERILKENWPKINSDLQRHDILHRLLSLLCMPIMVDQYYPEMKENFNLTFKLAIEKHHSALKQFLNLEGLISELIELQRNLFHCLELLIDNKSSILPGLAVEMYPKDNNHKSQLRLFRDEFPVLRDIYITTFETCHKTLKFVTAISNIAHRGNYNSFGADGPSNLNKFSKLPSAKKVASLSDLEVWSKHWGLLFNRQIRNSIGHHSARHDLSKGILLLKGQHNLPYLDFVVMCFKLFHPLLACCNALKIICIGFSMGKKD